MLGGRLVKDDGFTLVEVLVVLVIVGLLAAVGFPALWEQRASARRVTLQADVRNVGLLAEAYYAEAGTYDGFDGSSMESGFARADGVTITVDDESVSSFCVSGRHVSLAGEVWSFDSDRVGAPRLESAPCGP